MDTSDGLDVIGGAKDAFASQHCNKAQKNYPNNRKRNSSNCLCISKSQADLLNQKKKNYYKLILFCKRIYKTMPLKIYLLDGK